LIERTEVWSADQRAVYIGKRTATGWKRLRVDTAPNAFRRIPIVHIQNLPQPFFYEGISDVEPLIPLQDELNTRLSDRANRVTFQSFKMYLGRGIEQFTERPVGPGQMWATDNLDASIQEFGGDADSPSETVHIEEIRQAMDKTSGVTPVAAGLIRDKVGNLTSENALRIVLMGLLARTQKKRVTYGGGIERLCELVLHAADIAGVLRTEPDQRRVRIDWPNPFPQNESQLLANAKLKLDIGVPRRQVLAELGYEAET
ncbi:MAG: phage portal protein, partial [Rhodospirillales bacterium]|nr:phage portal protein [Rhodospirillales bacterium]